MAIWFAAMMLASTLVFTAAPAAAQGATELELTAADLKLRAADGTYGAYPEGRFIRPGDQLRVTVTGSLTCTNPPTATITATLDVNGELIPAEASHPSATFASGSANIDFTVTGNFTGTAGLESATASATHTFTLTPTTTCTVPDLNPSGVETSPAVPADTRSPAITFTAAASRTILAGPERVGLVTADVASIGSIVQINGGWYTETYPASATIDVSAFGWGTGPTAMPITNTGSNVTWFAIRDSAVAGQPAINSEAKRVLLTITDVYGNTASTAALAAADITVDNVRPSATEAAGFQSARSTLVRHQYREGVEGSGTSFLYANHTATTPTNVPFVRALVRHTASGEEVRVDQASATAATPRAWSFSDPTRNFADAITVTLSPADAAGNVNPAITSSITFPVVDQAYGPEGASPATLGGTLFGRVFVNATSGVNATWTYGTDSTSQPGDFWVELLRERGNSVGYWDVSKTGDVEGHFDPRQQLDMVNETATPAVTTDDHVTAFRPSAPVANFDDIVLENLTHLGTSRPRNFLAGSYQLAVHVNGTSHNLISVNRFEVDSDAPDTENVAAYGNTLGVPASSGMVGAANAHGSDGNPFRVLFRVRDDDTDANTLARLDSGLRNITFELFDPTNGAVALRTSTSPATPARVTVSAGPSKMICSPDPSNFTTGYTLPYCADLTGWTPAKFNASAPAGGCGGLVTANTVANGPTNTSYLCKLWLDIEWNKSSRHTFVNETMFNGWVNATFPDLPAGKYKARVSSWDFANLNTTIAYPTSGSDTYVVAPYATVVSTTSSPRLTTDNKLEVEVGAAQRYVNPPGEVRASCVDSSGSGTATVRDVCPSPLVRIWVSNEATGTGTKVAERTPVTIGSSLYEETASRFMGALPNGTLTTASTQVYSFRYTGTAPIDLTAASLNFSRDVFVRSEAVAYDSLGAEIVRSSPWVRVSSSILPSLEIRAPAFDWAQNLTSERPYYNVTFDRKANPGAVVLRYTIEGVDSTFLYTSGDITPTTTAANPTPRYKLNWTGVLANGATPTSPTLPAGAYRWRVSVVDVASNEVISSGVRQFIMLPSNTSLELKPIADRGLVVATPRSYVSRTFELPFTVKHYDANLTSMDQIKVSLVTASNTLIPANTLGFLVTLRVDSGLDESAESTDLTATITLPASANNERYLLNVTAEVDAAPFRIGHASAYLPLQVDNEPPTASLSPAPSLATVHVGGTPPTDAASPAPAFYGVTRDTGAGIKLVEVRIRDLTTNETLEITQTGATRLGGIADRWANSSVFTSGGASVSLITVLPSTTGEHTWFLPTVNRGGALAPLWSATSASPFINLSHTYVVETRAVDRLGQVSAVNATTFDFDGSAPYLGYGTRLGLPTGNRAGILSETTRVFWHGSATLSVRVADNQCLSEVWLLGRSDKNPNETVRAKMTPSGVNATGEEPRSEGRYCYKDMPTTGGHRYATYSIDLRHAPHMTEDVTNYTYWWMAVDEAGQVSEIPDGSRTFRMEVIDAEAASVKLIFTQPTTGQVGGRALIRADIFEAANISHVNITISDVNNAGTILARGQMRAENATSKGWTRYVVDTQEDLNFTLELRDYLLSVTAYDVNWNRTGPDGPTCVASICTAVPTIFRVRDDGAPAVALDTPRAGDVVNATPVIKVRGFHKTLDTAGLVVRATRDGNASNLSFVPASELNYTELLSPNNTRQGYLVTYRPTNLTDNSTLLVNVTANVGGLVAGEQWTFRVDTQPPTVVSTLTGERAVPPKVWAVTGTQVRLTANDTVSAATILYTVNNGTETTYSSAITPSGDDGAWYLEYWARDTAGNVGPTQDLLLSLDRNGPRISVNGHGDEVLLTVTDGANGIGVNNTTVTVHYRYGSATAFTPITASQVAGGNSYRAVLPGNASATGLSYYFTALDLLGNQGTNYSATTPFTIPRVGTDPGEEPEPENEPPTLTITSPQPGDSVTREVDIRWTATDPEQAPVTIIVARRNPDTVIMPPATDPGHFVLNLSTIPAGSLTLVITASDGVHEVTEEVMVDVLPAETITAKPLPRVPVQPGVGIPIEVTITPVDTTVARATYSLVRNGTTIPGGPLTKTPAGTYAAVISANQSGSYSVVVDVVYADQSTESRTVGQFAVAPPTPPPETAPAKAAFPVSLMVLAALAVLVIALASYGAFGRWRK